MRISSPPTLNGKFFRVMRAELMMALRKLKSLAGLAPYLFIYVVCSGAGFAESLLVNRLAQHPSPYLALHGQDPVAWQEWNAETFARARRENKLLYVSVGYFACHWCHVMQRESYKDPAIAALLNRHFVPVKVDRELNNGVDDTLQLFSERLNGVAGWPLNAFVTPEGYPSFVVLYAPPEQFRGILQNLSGRWGADDQAIRKLAQQAAPAAPTRPRTEPLTPARTATASQNFMNTVWQEADTLQGGFGQAIKFPLTPQLGTLLEIYAHKPEAKLGSFLRLTFDQMAARALRDHVGGGFFRYTTDPAWDTPHFEKMLYDNAQLALLYLQASDVLREPAYRRVAETTFDFMQSTLQSSVGGLYTSTSAVDRQGREGAVFLWEPKELKALLTPEQYAAAFRVWQLGQARPFEHGYLPAEYAKPTDQERTLLAQAHTTLSAARKSRALPLDTKMNAGLNGLALSAFSRGQHLSPAYRKSATRIRNFLETELVRGDSLMKARTSHKTLAGAELEDYAYVVQGLLDYAEVNSDAKARALAQKLTRTAWNLFWSPTGWKREAKSLLATLPTEPVLADGALASPSEILNLATLGLRQTAWVQQVKGTAAWQSPQVERDPFVYPTRLRVLRALSPPR